MTERLYYKEPGLTEFDATIVATDREGEHHYTVLDRSAFYPTSGGQLFDTGMLNGVSIVSVEETSQGEVLHISQTAVGIAGDAVHGVVNAQRRKMHRQQHTAQHILSYAFHKLYGFVTVSVHLGEEYGAVEFDTASITAEQIAEAERLAGEIIFADRPIEILFVEREEALQLPLRKVTEREGIIRVIKIEGCDYSACGGTHCDRTGQVGLLKIVGVEKMRGHALVNFLAGEQARADYEARLAATSQLTQSLTCHVNDLVERVGRIAEENKEVRREIGRLQRELLPAQAEAIATEATEVRGRGLLIKAIDGYDSKLAGPLAGLIAERIKGLAALLVDGRLIVAVAPASGLHAGNVLKQLSAETGLRGGGGENLAQAGGADRADLAHYRALLERLLREE